MKLFEKNLYADSFTITKSLTINGNIEGAVSGRIEGIVRGNVIIEGRVIIADSAIIIGNLMGTEVIINGKVKGDVIAYKSIQVGSKGEVGGNISSYAIIIDPTAHVKGYIRKIKSSDKVEFQTDVESYNVTNVSPESATIPASKDGSVKARIIRKRSDDSVDGWW